MTLPEFKAQLEQMKKAKMNAHREICDLASGKRKFEMCIPPQKTDSDMVLQEPLDHMDALIEKLEVAVEALEFYANKKNWDDRWIDNEDGEDGGDIYDVILREDVDIETDKTDLDKSWVGHYSHGGKKARETLQKITGGGK